MSARTNKVDEDPNGILLGYLRLFCFDPCGEKEADTEEREKGIPAQLMIVRRKPGRRDFQGRRGRIG